jgi:hypothetical protein
MDFKFFGFYHFAFNARSVTGVPGAPEPDARLLPIAGFGAIGSQARGRRGLAS